LLGPPENDSRVQGRHMACGPFANCG